MIHLHVHSEYSLLDGAIRIPELVKEVKSRGHSAVALTDHANLHGVIDFYDACKKQGVKALVGAELYMEALVSDEAVDSAHQGLFAEENQAQKRSALVFNAVFIAKNNRGYSHLTKLVSMGHTIAFEQKRETPTTPWRREWMSDLFILLSCNQSEFSCAVDEFSHLGIDLEGLDSRIREIDPRWQRLESFKQKLLDLGLVIGGDQSDVYVELCKHGLPDEDKRLNNLYFAAKTLGFPVVASCNAHTLHEKDEESHLVLLGIKNDLKLADVRQRLHGVKHHLRSDEEMAALFKAFPGAVDNTLKIAEACSVSFSFGEYRLPKISSEMQKDNVDGTTENLLGTVAKQGLSQRIDAARRHRSISVEEEKVYYDRLDFEIDVINRMGFADYFLIVQDFINWAKSQDIPVGPGRGSGAGSLVAYALRITDLDPLPYNLIFERFLNPERVSMPDFDIDFCQDRRDEVIRYVIDKYGQSRVAQIVTFGKMLAKAVIRDVGRVLGVSYSKIDQLAKLIPMQLGITLEDALKIEPKISQITQQDPLLADVLRLALQLEGLTRHSSVHAAGVIIADQPLDEYVPVSRSEVGQLITQFEMKNAEKIGLIKFDFLGLKTLTVIQNTIKIIERTTGVKVEIEAIDLSDKKVYDLISSAKSVGVFQLESEGMQQLLRRLKPSQFEDVIALVALYRPGPLGSGMVDDFVERKHGRSKIEYALPQLEPILSDTYGTILYQEQVQKIAAELANYTLGEADLLRRAMGKKKPEEMAQQKTRFVEGCAANKIDPKISDALFDLMAKFAEYGFNKSHSAAYGLISYQTAYLKTHYPEAFFAASMSSDLDNTDKLVRFIQDARSFGVTVLQPCINQSEAYFTVPGRGLVRFGLAAIKGIGGGLAEWIIDQRLKHGKNFTTIKKFCSSVDLQKLGKKNLETLIYSGAFDVFGYPRSVMIGQVDAMFALSGSRFSERSQRSVQPMLFAGVDNDEEDDSLPDPDKNLSLSFKELSEKEVKLLGTYVSEHPLNLYQFEKRRFQLDSLAEFKAKTLLVTPKSKAVDLKVLALLVDVFTRRSKSDKLMLCFRLEDSQDEFIPMMFDWQEGELPVFEKNEPYVFTFKVSAIEGRGVYTRIKDWESLESYRSKSLQPDDCLTLKLSLNQSAGSQPSHEKSIMQQLRQLFAPTTQANLPQLPVELFIDYGDSQLKIDLEDRLSVSNLLLEKVHFIGKKTSLDLTYGRRRPNPKNPDLSHRP